MKFKLRKFLLKRMGVKSFINHLMIFLVTQFGEKGMSFKFYLRFLNHLQIKMR